MASVISFINQKGGCGKSSTCLHLAGAFAAAGYRVLLVDMDPQGSLSRGFLGPEAVERLTADETLAFLFADDVQPVGPGTVLRETDHEGLSLLPANHLLAEFNTPAPELTGMAQFALREYLDKVGTEFDFILIDCPPNLYRCTWLAAIAADIVVIPVPPEDFGAQGLRAVHQLTAEASRLNPRLQEPLHLITRCDRRLAIHRMYVERLRLLYGDSVLATVIHELTAFKVALAFRGPVQVTAPDSMAAGLTRKLSREILDRINMKCRIRQVA